MIYKPNGCMWDPTVLYFKGQYYMLSMYRNEAEKPNYGMWCAKSEDGVHWEDLGCVLEEEFEIYKMFAYVCGDEVIINHGSFSQKGLGGNDTLRFYKSKDMTDWEFMYASHPDARWYNENGRWDHMYCMAKNPDKPEEGCFGYVVATPKPEHHSSWGILESDDGYHFKVLPPPVIDWSQIPYIDMLEGGGCEKIGEKYYYIGGMVGYPASFGYSLFTFTADNPAGPFKPDLEAFRLCGFNPMPGRIFVQNLAAFCRGEKGELLVSNAIDAGGLEKIFLLPMRKAVVDQDGHLRLGYWENNNLLKGKEILLPDNIFTMTCAHEYQNPSENEIIWDHPYFKIEDHTLEMKTLGNINDFQLEDFSMLVMLEEEFDHKKGVLIEGKIKIAQFPSIREGETNKRLWRPSSVGIFVGEADHTGMAITLEAGHPYNRHSYVENIDYNGVIKRTIVDTTDKSCATVAGIDTDVEHRFVFLYRHNMFELYVDGLLVQCFVHLKEPAGRLGFIIQNAKCEISGLKIYQMNLDQT